MYPTWRIRKRLKQSRLLIKMENTPYWIETSVYFLIYAIIHSLTASISFKRLTVKIWPKAFVWYRLIYNILSIMLLLLLYGLIPKSGKIIYNFENEFKYFLYSLQILSGIAFIISARQFDVFEFSGIRQVWRYYKTGHVGEHDEKLQLNSKGIYGISRHPLYLFTIFIFLFLPVMTEFRLVLTVWLILYFYIGSFFEEKRLIKYFGSEYLEYKNKVSRIFPLKWLVMNMKIICRKYCFTAEPSI